MQATRACETSRRNSTEQRPKNPKNSLVSTNTWPNDPFCNSEHYQPAPPSPTPSFGDDTPLSEDVVFNVATLTRRLAQELRAAKKSHLSCGEVHLPCGLLRRVARDISSMAESEPCGLRGCHIYVVFEPYGALPSTRIAKIECDPGTACTFELYLTLKQSSTGWNFFPQFLRAALEFSLELANFF
ncbi:hypothetical protein D910_10317 [Dendroctonus ponderosae]|uniref:Uncharacterized protein n=1 Tax=Dendroctonus ponderosae TaxID=77166 RepID=U4USD9_DENPD|nr:hypothetical protein D910_10317 [Dendroctonus ponderosae]